MSGGFFRGTTADQDTRFSNKHAKLLKSHKFPPELENLVDMTKVKMDVMRPWIAHRVTEILGFEDEVLINFIYGLLEEKVVNGKEIQISLTGFMEKNTGKFMKELWTHLLSAQQNASGVPQQFLDAKEEETRKKQEDMDRITRELKRTKEKEGREHDEERVRMDKEVDNGKAAALEPHSRRPTKFSSKWSADDKETDERNGSKGLARSSRSPHAVGRSLSPPRGVRSRSKSKSLSNSRSHSRSRSLSASPKHVRQSVSSERRHHSLSRRSFTPRRVDSRLRSPSSTPSRGRSPSPSPARRRLQSPARRRSRSPVRRRSRSPARRRSRSPLRRRSRSPIRRRSRSPIRRRSRSPIRRRSRSPIRRRLRSPIRRRSRSLIRRRSRSLIRRRSQSPIQRRSRTPIRRRSPSPFQRRPRSPYRQRSQSSASPSPIRGRSPSPMRRRYQRASSTPRHRSTSPSRRRTTFTAHQRSPSPRSMSLSPSGRISRSPTHGTPSALPKGGSPKRQERSPVQYPKDGHRIVQRHAPDRQPPRKETAERPHVSVRSSERDLKGRRVSHNGGTASSSSLYNSPRSVSPPASGRSPSVERSPIPPKRHRESMNAKDRLDDVKTEDLTFSRVKADRRENKETVIENLDKNKRLPEKLPSHHSSGAQVQKRKSDNDDARRTYPELTEEPPRSRKDILSSDRTRESGKGYKADDIKSIPRHHEASKLPKVPQKVEKADQSGSLHSGSDESDDQKRKRKRSKKKDISSDDDDNSHDSQTDDRNKAKKRRKEEKKLKKEERRKRREERRRKKDNRRSEKLKLRAGRSVSPSSDHDKSPDSHDDAFSDQKKLEIELREKALESLRAKKGVGH